MCRRSSSFSSPTLLRGALGAAPAVPVVGVGLLPSWIRLRFPFRAGALLPLLFGPFLHAGEERAPSGLAGGREIGFEDVEVGAIAVHADEALEQLDLAGPDAFVFFAAGAFAFVDGRLEYHGDALEARLVHHVPECAEAEKAGAYVGMEVAVAVQGGFAVVEVQGFEEAQADDAVELLEGGAEGGGGTEVISGGENVAGVEADADAGLVVRLDVGDDGGEFVKGGSDVISTAGHGFEERRHGRGSGQGCIELFADSSNCRGTGRRTRRARTI